MSLREEWTFQLPVKKLLEAAQAKLKHHHARFEHWQHKKTEAKLVLKEKGIDIIDYEEEAQYLSNSMGTGRRGGRATFKEEFQRTYEDAHNKVREHRGKLLEYSSWANVLGSQKDPEHTYNLEYDDWMFFFGLVNKTDD